MSEENQEAQGSESQTDESSAASAGSNEQQQSTDNQQQASDGSKDSSEGRTATTSGVPEEYTLSLDEESPLPDEHMDEVAAYARKQGLSNKQAQEILERDSKLVADFKDQQLQTWERTVDDWEAQTKADKEIGGDRLAESAELAKRVLQRYGTEPLIEIMKSGYGNHPEVVRMFSRIGKELVEAKLITADGPVGKHDGKSLAESFYGDSSTN